MKPKPTKESANGIDEHDKELASEIEEFSKERQKIRKFLDAVNKTKQGPFDKLIDVGFVLALILLVLARFAFGWIDNILSLEFGVLLVSMKIIWLMRTQNNYNHFIFWILHTIEYRENLILKRLDDIEKKLQG